MLSSSWRASGAPRTGVLLIRTTYLRPRTAAAGLTASTSLSPASRTAASACLTLGGENSRPRLSTQAGDVHRLDIEQLKPRIIAPIKELRGRSVVSLMRVRIADVGGEEFDEAATGVLTARGDQHRDDGAGLGKGE